MKELTSFLFGSLECFFSLGTFLCLLLSAHTGFISAYLCSRNFMRETIRLLGGTFAAFFFFVEDTFSLFGSSSFLLFFFQSALFFFFSSLFRFKFGAQSSCF